MLTSSPGIVWGCLREDKGRCRPHVARRNDSVEMRGGADADRLARYVRRALAMNERMYLG